MRRALWCLAVLFGHWRRHRLQAATLVTGLIAATALWSGVQALNDQARSSYDRAATIFGGARTAMLLPADGLSLPQATFVALRRAGWPVSPVLEGRVTIGTQTVRVVGVDPVTLPPNGGGASLAPDEAPAFMLPPGRALVAPETLNELGLAEGATPTLADGRTLPPLRALPQALQGTLVTDIGIAQRLLNQPGRMTRLLLADGFATMAPAENVAGTALRYVAADAETDVARLTDSFHLNLTAFGLLSFLVGLFIVHAAVGLAFEQRRATLRTLRACGLSARLLGAMLIVEILLIAAAAGAVGLVCGYLVAAALLPDVAASLRGLYGAPVPGQLALRPQWIAAGFAIALGGALAASALSLVQAARLPLLATAQPQAWRAAQRRTLLIQLVAAAGIAGAGAACLAVGDTLLAGFAVLAAMLLGAALALPSLLAGALRLGEGFARGAVPRWVLADARQQMSGLSLALMALLLALAVNVGVGTMVGSFSATFSSWLDGRLAADVYLNARDPAQGRAIRDWLKARPEVQAILPAARADTVLGGGPVELIGFADDPLYRERWPLLDSATGAWDRLFAGNGAFVSEQLARRIKRGVGDSIDVPTSAGRWRVTIAAVYADYGNPKGQIGVATDALVAHFPELPQTRTGLRVTDGAAPGLVDALRETFGLDPRNLADQTTLKAESRRIFARTFAVTAALNTFTLGVAGIALLTSLLTLAQSRLPQLAPLWALGIERRTLAWLELGKTLALALLTALLALPLGLAVAWCLVAIVNVRAFGWRLPLYVFPGQMATLLGVALLAAALASAWPILRLLRMQPADLIRVFAHER